MMGDGATRAHRFVPTSAGATGTRHRTCATTRSAIPIPSLTAAVSARVAAATATRHSASHPRRRWKQRSPLLGPASLRCTSRAHSVALPATLSAASFAASFAVSMPLLSVLPFAPGSVACGSILVDGRQRLWATENVGLRVRDLVCVRTCSVYTLQQLSSARSARTLGRGRDKLPGATGRLWTREGPVVNFTAHRASPLSLVPCP